jgi:hypothetical protein
VDSHGEIPVGLGSNLANQVTHSGHAIWTEVADLPKDVQFLDDLVKSAVQFSDGPVGWVLTGMSSAG